MRLSDLWRKPSSIEGLPETTTPPAINREEFEAQLVLDYRTLQAAEAEHKVSRLHARDLNEQLNSAIDRERELARNIVDLRSSLARSMARYESLFGDDIAIAAEGQVITRGFITFIRRKLIQGSQPGPEKVIVHDDQPDV